MINFVVLVTGVLNMVPWSKFKLDKKPHLHRIVLYMFLLNKRGCWFISVFFFRQLFDIYLTSRNIQFTEIQLFCFLSIMLPYLLNKHLYLALIGLDILRFAAKTTKNNNGFVLHTECFIIIRKNYIICFTWNCEICKRILWSWNIIFLS